MSERGKAGNQPDYGAPVVTIVGRTREGAAVKINRPRRRRRNPSTYHHGFIPQPLARVAQCKPVSGARMHLSPLSHVSGATACNLQTHGTLTTPVYLPIVTLTRLFTRMVAGSQ
ncbi:hypothetical protein BP6252_11804 [Coleophoma cylindrospora]|uniref:Uncharacterized protein n=1 Tax=Coleophoma cylindrospora TaxID=1849047 RepID=A0A3D8QKY9_9HELO|nr:hypothetical protein BP6252_11804 [Coleophoma cylindrospora]